MSVFGKNSNNCADVINETVVKDVPVLKFIEQYQCVVFYRGTLVIADNEAPPISSSCISADNKIGNYDKVAIQMTNAPEGTVCDLVVQECQGTFNGVPQSGTVYKARDIRLKN